MKNLETITYSSVIGMGVVGIALGGLAMNSIFLGAVSAISVGLLLLKLRESSPWLFNQILKYQLMSDLVLSLLLVLIIGTSTATSVLGAITATVFASTGLMYLKKNFLSRLG